MRYVLFHSKSEGSYQFSRFSEGSDIALLHLPEDAVQEWEYNAKSHFEAMQAYYTHMNWGTYKPEPDWEDEFFSN